jgi:hypothetical protein
MRENSYKMFALAFVVLVGASLVVAGDLLAIAVIQWWGYALGWVGTFFLIVKILQSAASSESDKATNLWYKGSSGGRSDSGNEPVPTR